MIHASKRSVNTNGGFQTKLKHSALAGNKVFMNRLESMIESSETTKIHWKFSQKTLHRAAELGKLEI